MKNTQKPSWTIYYEKHREEICRKNRERNKIWRQTERGREKTRKKSLKQYYKHKEKHAARHKIWESKNRKEINKRRRLAIKNNPERRLAARLRSRIWYGLKKGSLKVGSSVRDLGCSIKELKNYLESKFQPGMTWKNYGRCGWHIDHIIPLSQFDLTDRKEFLKACHYTNLQPLWWKDNLSKGAK